MAEGNEIQKSNGLANTASQIAKITTTEMARKMVLKYATDLVGDKRAHEFFMHMAFLERTNPAIARCTPESKFHAMMQAVAMNLMPNTPDQHCALIPYGNQLQFQPMYKGGIELAYRSGLVKTIKADNVFPEDYFDYDDAMNEIHHRKNLEIDRTDSSRIKATYAVAKLKDGEIMFEVMSPSEIKKIKEKAVKATSGQSPWKTWDERMTRKSPLKRLIAVLPKSAEDNRFKRLAWMDDMAEAGKKVLYDPRTGDFMDGEVVDPADKKEQARARIAAAAAKQEAMDASEHEPTVVETVHEVSNDDLDKAVSGELLDEGDEKNDK